MSERLGGTGTRKTEPGKRTVPLANGTTGTMDDGDVGAMFTCYEFGSAVLGDDHHRAYVYDVQ